MQRKIAILGLLAAAGFANASFFDSFDAADYSGSGPAGGTIASVINWTAVNNSTGGPGTTGWFDGNVGVFGPNSGPKYIGANYNNSTGANGVSNWLMSDVRTFQNGDTISFFTRTVGAPASFPDRLYLKLSLNGASTNPGDFSTVLVTVNGGLTTTGYPAAWTMYSATLTGLGGPTSGRFAFHYSTTSGGPLGSEADYIGIDDVRYSAVPEPATMAALGLGAAALIRRRRK